MTEAVQDLLQNKDQAKLPLAAASKDGFAKLLVARRLSGGGGPLYDKDQVSDFKTLSSVDLFSWQLSTRFQPGYFFMCLGAT